VYDAVKRSSRRLLDGHRSVLAMDYRLNADGRDMVLLGMYTLRIGVDSIALDSKGEWLYYGPVNGDRLYRVATRDLDDPALDAATLAARVQDYGPKTASDGLTTDLLDRIYITDPEHSAILTLGPDGALATLLKDPSRLRWPDGFSFGSDGWLYVTCSALQHVLFRGKGHQRDHAPFQVYRFKPGAMGIPGH
jgi:sugar lactone lactonase YvrE